MICSRSQAEEVIELGLRSGPTPKSIGCHTDNTVGCERVSPGQRQGNRQNDLWPLHKAPSVLGTISCGQELVVNDGSSCGGSRPRDRETHGRVGIGKGWGKFRDLSPCGSAEMRGPC